MYAFLIFEVIALLAAVLRFGKAKESSYGYFLPYLIIIVIYEIGSTNRWFGVRHDHQMNNLWIANIEITFEFIFFSLLLISTLKDNFLKKKYYLLFGLVLVLTVIDVVFIQGFWRLCTFAILVQYTLLIFFVYRFFYELLKSFDARVRIIRLPAFWINTGLLFFCLAQFLFFTSFTFMAYSKNYQYVVLFEIINNLSNVILYSCITIALLCLPRTKTLSY
jgi:hypothetical protein